MGRKWKPGGVPWEDSQMNQDGKTGLSKEYRMAPNQRLTSQEALSGMGISYGNAEASQGKFELKRKPEG